MAILNPYLVFGGNCEEAFKFYKSVFGGEFTAFSRFKEMPSEDPLPPELGEKILHICLPVWDTQLMGADTSPQIGSPPLQQGNNVFLSLNPQSVEEGRALFEALLKGGKTLMPFEKAFWGDHFGMLEDKFGINWQINC